MSSVSKSLLWQIAATFFVSVLHSSAFAMMPDVYILPSHQEEEVPLFPEWTDVYILHTCTYMYCVLERL